MRNRLKYGEPSCPRNRRWDGGFIDGSDFGELSAADNPCGEMIVLASPTMTRECSPSDSLASLLPVPFTGWVAFEPKKRYMS